MTLVSPSQSNPGDEITADAINNPVNEIAAVVNGNIDNDNISAVSGSKIANGSVTLAKLATDATPGFKIGTIAGATLGTTGNKAITGVGFTPRIVRFTVASAGSTSTATFGVGAMTTGSQFYSASSADGSVGSRQTSTTACIGWLSAGSTTPSLLASYVSMDADGFTINVSTASSTFAVYYEAVA